MDNPAEQFRELLGEILAEKCTYRYGWKRSKLDAQQREYIIEREGVIEAIRKVQQVTWQSIDCTNRELAEQIRENAMHSLATLARAMTLNEERML